MEYRLAEFNNQSLKLKVYDELLVNAGKSIVYNRFDHNRIYAGLSYAVLKGIEVEAGYLNWYQQRPAGDQFYNRHILNFAFIHRIDLMNKRNDSEG